MSKKTDYQQLWKREKDKNRFLEANKEVMEDRIQIIIALLCKDNGGEYNLSRKKLQSLIGHKIEETHAKNGDITFKLVKENK